MSDWDSSSVLNEFTLSGLENTERTCSVVDILVQFLFLENWMFIYSMVTQNPLFIYFIVLIV